MVEIRNCMQRARLTVTRVLDHSRVNNIRIASEIPPTTTLRHNIDQIKSWIATCSRSHQSCSERTTYVPPRLLNVIGTNGTIQLIPGWTLEAGGEADIV